MVRLSGCYDPPAMAADHHRLLRDPETAMISLLRFRATVLFVATFLMTGYGSQSSPANRPWPPGVQKVSDDSPPFSPADALKTFFMPPGYHLELVASEPLVQDPVAMDWDTEGRLWVVEMPGFMADITASNEHDPIGRVVVLEDTNGDGTMDKRTVFADGLVLARSLKVLDHGILVSEPPNVWLMHDTNGDLKMDTKDLVTDQFGRRDTDPENNANSFYWALDNRMYTSGQTTTQFRFKDGKFQQEKTLERGEWGVAQDDAGHIFRNTNESALHVDYVPTSYFARNPNLLRTRGSYERLATDTNGLNTVWPVRPNPGTNRAYQTGIDRPDGTLAKFTAVCAPVAYRGDRLPADVYGNAFVAEPSANLVSRIVLSDDGTSLQARKAYEQGEFLASTDERFRPVYLSNAPDGTLYIVDIYRGIIEHRLSLTVYLREHILKRKLDDVTGYGRIYRVVHETTRRDTRRSLSEANPSQLVEMLADSGGWWRDTAQRLLIERADRLHAPGSQDLNETGRSVVARLKAIATDAKDWRTRLRALWTLDGIDAIDPASVLAALEDRSRDVRVSAIRLSERWLGEANDRVHSAVLKRLEDDDWSVRQQLAASLGAMPSSERDSAMVTLLERHADDPIVLDAALSGLRGSEASVLGRLLAGDAPTAQREAAVTMLAATIVRSTDDDAIGRLFEWTGAGGKPQWQRSALLRGAEIALLGATMPGTPAPNAAAAAGTAPCPTCPGGRAGPGGAYAYSKDEDFARAGLRGGRGGRPDLRLSREPQALSDLAASGGELATRATSVLARVTWPGKPGALTVTPLTPEEERRFEAGRDVYRNICQACHQPDGRGQDRVAPSLVGSQLLFAPAGVPTRILLNGKDGKIGLMPPIGFALDDEQIASVLTYVRREWGQTGAAVDPAAVKEVRAATTGRTRPWTDDELMALAGEKK
jgi:mono/diheme cytochrome c family protein/glucose/arabinose dehydrogenase